MRMLLGHVRGQSCVQPSEASDEHGLENDAEGRAS